MVSADKVSAIRLKAEALAGQTLGEDGHLLVEMAAQRACAFCCREDIPEEMEQAVAALVLTLGETSGAVKSITRGDTAISYDASGGDGSGPMAALAPFRRLGRLKEAGV